MRQNTRVTFAMRDLDRLKCIEAVVDGDLKLVRAAERLGLTTRQVRRLARRYAAGVPVGLVSKSTPYFASTRPAARAVKASRSSDGRFMISTSRAFVPTARRPRVVSNAPMERCRTV